MSVCHKVKGVSIGGIAACVPKGEIDNLEFGRELFGDSLEGALKVTGVRKRRVCEEEKVTSLDLCVYAAKALAERASIDYSDFGGVIFVTLTPDLPLPNNATLAHSLLGFPPESAAFDMSLACPGYPYGLWAAAMMAKSTGRKILLLDGDTHSHFVSSRDRATALLFGDAGSATVVAPSEGAEAWTFDFVTDGALRDVLAIPEGGYRKRFNARSAEYTEREEGAFRRGIDMKMDGIAVFNAVVRYAPGSLKRVMESDGASEGDYGYLVLHQANLMMIRQIAKKLGFKDERFPLSLDRYGNVGSATIPLTICSELGETIRNKSSRILMSAFGAGFSVASAGVSIGPCPCAGVVEYEDHLSSSASS